MEEHFFVGLRQSAGIEPEAEAWRRFAAPIRRLTRDGLLEQDGPRLRLTGRGVVLSNLVFQEFLA
jgi:oxygen-independent coproporphyrinogen-3 oxidase